MIKGSIIEEKVRELAKMVKEDDGIMVCIMADEKSNDCLLAGHGSTVDIACLIHSALRAKPELVPELARLAFNDVAREKKEDKLASPVNDIPV